VYADNRPCDVCGAEVRLEPATRPHRDRAHDPDGTVDERICTNGDCETNQGSDRTP
jgi:hypothetical protein